ncbi:hypothetical protein FDP22_08390 [Paroceanicella profunda]|uniref:Sulfotransferase n=1 Tax=Paroceanicella profunda TaxID=2579971 RepID=A0A5B8FGY1_9RHOB|nr:hypothetical protein [Paroceanicella profunda]QDL91791.1 hypothetical protein FDP22_08390 [Paroceanicella profunda]
MFGSLLTRLKPGGRRRRIHLHIGAPKTGTTTLQTALATHRRMLAREGAIYPRAGCLASGAGVAQHLLALSLRAEYPAFIAPPERQPAEQVWAALLAEIDRAPAGDILLSSEAFFHLDTQAVARVAEYLSGHEVHVVAVERNPLQRLRSRYIQSVKAPPFGRLDFHAYALRATRRQADDARLWEATFGSAAVTRLRYDAPTEPGGLVPSVLVACGLSPATAARIDPGPQWLNRSPGWPVVSLMRRLNAVRHVPAETRQRLYVRLVEHGVPADLAGFDALTEGFEDIRPPVRLRLREVFLRHREPDPEPSETMLQAFADIQSRVPSGA